MVADQSGDLLLSLTGRAIALGGVWPSRVPGVKRKILSIDLPHELRAKFNGLFEFLFGLLL
jgi:hypothetical protein